MNRLLFILLIAIQAVPSIAQQETPAFKSIKTIGTDIVNFTVDNLGNVYVLDKSNLLKKLNPQGDSIAVFNDVRRYGKVYSIDATNPLKILLYYKDFSTILVLDRLLNVRNTIDLRKLGIFQVKAIAQSYDNGIWVYDELEAKIKRLNDDGVVVDQSSDFRQGMEVAPSPIQIVDQEKLVYLYDTVQGVFVFDYYGSLKNKIALGGWKDFQVIGNTVFGRKAGFFERYELGSLSLSELPLDSSLAEANQVKVTPGKLYSLKDGIITIYER